MKKALIVVLALLCMGCDIKTARVINPAPRKSEETYEYLEQGRMRLAHVKVLRYTNEGMYVKSSEGYFYIHGDYIAKIPVWQLEEEGI